MGAGASVNAETFATIKDHYEAKKAEGKIKLEICINSLRYFGLLMALLTCGK